MPTDAGSEIRTLIHRLPPLLVNQIAAGEVIERPASVVKELVENAIDADATRLRVSIEHGGRELIEVVDDGCGMSAEDLPLAVAPHATSKIREACDLDAIATLGFRGEALASIMSVSRMTIVSRPRPAEVAHKLGGEGDRLRPVEPTGAPPGTTITVRNLFFNTPARRKFLRTDLTEYNHINAQMTRAALSHPAIGFTFVNNGNTVFDLPAGQAPADRILDVLGRELADELHEVSANERGPQRSMSLWGMVGTPSLARGTNRFQYVFLNGRPIRDKTVMHAVKEAYRGLIDPTRFPMVVLYLEMDPSQVDVNVHPAKAEVRFRDSQAVHGLLYSTIRDRLRHADITPIVDLEETPRRTSADAALGAGEQGIFRVSSSFTSWDIHSADDRRASADPDVRTRPASAGAEVDRGRLVDFIRSRDPHRDLKSGFTFQEAQRQLVQPNEENPGAGRRQSELEPGDVTADAEADDRPVIEARGRRVFQVHDSYLVIEDEDGISIVDQHALHERVMFEALKLRILEGPLESQRLLTPAVVQLTESQMESLEQMRPLLERMGIEAQPLGARSLGVHAFPSFLFSRRVDPVQFVTELFDRTDAEGLTPGDEEALHEVLDMMACKAAVKAGDRMSDIELNDLLELSEQIERAGRCPHGRPTTIRVSLRDLEKQFGRR